MEAAAPAADSRLPAKGIYDVLTAKLRESDTGITCDKATKDVIHQCAEGGLPRPPSCRARRVAAALVSGAASTHHSPLFLSRCRPAEFVHIVAVELVAQALKGKKRTITAANAVDALKDLGFGDYAEDAEADGDAAMVAHVRAAAPSAVPPLRWLDVTLADPPA
jgi:hypothetical protein